MLRRRRRRARRRRSRRRSCRRDAAPRRLPGRGRRCCSFGRRVRRPRHRPASRSTRCRWRCFPSRVTLEVTPGNARAPGGPPLTIEARLVGNRAPVVAQLLRADGDAARSRPIGADRDAATRRAFTLALDVGRRSFKYRVVAGAVTSPIYEVTVARAAARDADRRRVHLSAGARLEPRTEEDGGDIYAPAGTDVRVRVHTDRRGRHRADDARQTDSAIALTPAKRRRRCIGYAARSSRTTRTASRSPTARA